ncbi:YjbH domain-containing protein [Sulfuricurvum sp. RIFCSPLOWO2_12_FULL_43_24]|uniref:YjbH domain-containing protein n=1 Tax=Sulfuricurvum sp. RIFCSPLOWO2_12_FULL_43_24 TaxID=1802247 RepID=UPI0008D3D04D|nr:YjbH domain-containing protein [Sulfuricurvum sp. RIFCSPLOWO2_12_FULL_43_24]OHD90704.1 MAG: hypothetical protein A3G19_04145 [Sulfuricurvum sp. RIFCSPLOWO2_12_FULL_43_24]
MRGWWCIACLCVALNAEIVIPLNQVHTDFSAQNSGKTGLIETPNARVMNDWRVRPHYFYSDPFLYYGVLIAPLPRLELNLRMTQVRGVPGFGDSAGYGDYKDKAIDFKFLLAKEDRILPAIAVGFDDIQGTGLYSSKYLVASKRFGWIDMSGGYALGRLGGEDLSRYGANYSSDRGIDFLTSTEIRGGGWFGGLEAHFTPDLSLKAEYSPINYHYDFINPFTQNKSPMPKTSINIGLSYKLSDKVTLAANYERGTSYGLGFNITIPFDEEGLYLHQSDSRWRAKEGTPERFSHYDDQNLSIILADEIAAEKYSNVDVAVYKNKIWAGLENPKYNSSMKALGRAADILDEVAPDRFDRFYLALKQTDLEYSVLTVNRDEIKQIKSNPTPPIPPHAIEYSSDVEKSYEEFSEGKELFKSPTVGSKNFAWLFKPSLETYLNDKDNPLTYKLSVLGGARYQALPGGYMFGRLMFPLYNTTDEITLKALEPAASATRTDSLKYIQYNGVQLYDLAFDQVVKLPLGIYGRAEVGYFEPAYGGIGLECYRPFDGGRFGIGLEYQRVKKRQIEDMFGFEDTRFDGKFINLYANLFPKLGIKTTAKIGEFFAGDRGVSWTVMREYKDFTIGVFITKTTTDMFVSAENRGYMDKGIFLSIPFSTVTDRKVKGALHYGLKPWSRDVAQYANQFNSLVGLDPANIFEMNTDRESFKK